MSRFSYLAVASGRRVHGTLRSRDRREATRKLLEMGYHPIRVETAEPVTGERAGHWIGARRVPAIELAVFTRQFAALLKAGLPMVHALATLRQQSGNPRLVRVIEQVEEKLSREAATLYEALSEHPRVFGAVYRGLVQSGEGSGTLPEVLSQLATHLTRTAQVRSQVLGAFIYPIFLCILGSASIFVLMSFVIPRFRELFESFGGTLPLATRILIAVSDTMARWWWAIILGVLAAFAGGTLALRRQAVRAKRDALLLRLPVLGPMVLKIEVARLARTLGTLLANGVRILDALRVTGQAAANVSVRNSFESITRQVATGEPLSVAARNARLYPPLMINLIRTGEETGQLAEMLAELSQIYEEEADRAVVTAVKLLEPALIVVMGGAISAIVAGVILPIFKAGAMVQ